MIPNKYEGMNADMSTEEPTTMLQETVPQHPDFAKKILADHGVPTGDADRTLPAARVDRGDSHPHRL